MTETFPSAAFVSREEFDQFRMQPMCTNAKVPLNSRGGIFNGPEVEDCVKGKKK